MENVTPRSHRTMALLQFLQFLLHTRAFLCEGDLGIKIYYFMTAAPNAKNWG